MWIPTRDSAKLAAIGALTWGALILNASAVDTIYARIESLDKRFDALISPSARIEKIADDLEWSEGPLWDAKTQSLLFSDIPRNVVMQWNARERRVAVPRSAAVTPARAPFTGREPGSNGLTFDPQGRLTLCQHGDRRISYREADGKYRCRRRGLQGQEVSTAPTISCTTTRATCISPIRPSDCRARSRIPTRSCRSTPCSAWRHGRQDQRGRDRARSAERPRLLAGLQDPVRRQRARRRSRSGRLTRCSATAASTRVACSPKRSSYIKKGDGVPDGLKVDVQGNVFATGPGGVLRVRARRHAASAASSPTCRPPTSPSAKTARRCSSPPIIACCACARKTQGHAAARRQIDSSFFHEGVS